MSGINVVMEDDCPPIQPTYSVLGMGNALRRGICAQQCKRGTSLQRCFLHFAQAFRLHTALANGQAKIEERLARWLLMAHDRLDRDELPLRHEFLALMLSVAEAWGHSRSATSGKSGAHQREAWADRGAESGRPEEDRNWPLRHPASRVPQANRLERQSLGVGKDDKNRLPASPP